MCSGASRAGFAQQHVRGRTCLACAGQGLRVSMGEGQGLCSSMGDAWADLGRPSCAASAGAAVQHEQHGASCLQSGMQLRWVGVALAHGACYVPAFQGLVPVMPMYLHAIGLEGARAAGHLTHALPCQHSSQSNTRFLTSRPIRLHCRCTTNLCDSSSLHDIAFSIPILS